MSPQHTIVHLTKLHITTILQHVCLEIVTYIQSYCYWSGFTESKDAQLDGYVSTNIAPMYDGFRNGKVTKDEYNCMVGRVTTRNI